MSEFTPNEHIDKATFKRIFSDHWSAFITKYPRYDTDDYNSVIQKMIDCGNPAAMGYAQYRCTQCGETRQIAFTCKSSFCLSCAKAYTEHWADFISRRLLPGVSYRHTVLTVPDFLHPAFFQNPKLLPLLIQTGHACLKDTLATSSRQHLDIGSIIVLQTAGRKGNFNPHLHILLTAGGLTPKQVWKNVSYFPFPILHRKWQFHLLTMIKDQLHSQAINSLIDQAWKNYPSGFVAFVEKGDTPPNRRGLARYLAKYVVSPPISVHRIERYDGHTVRYWYRDHKSGQIKHESLPVLIFIGRMAQHILPKGFQRIRYYGIHANTRYAQVRHLLAPTLPSPPPPDPATFYVLPRQSFAQLFTQAFGSNPLLCPRCKNPFELELIFHPRYGIIRQFNLFTEFPNETAPPTRPAAGLRRPLELSQRMVQLSLPLV